jgi:hypothetical protein
LLYLTNTIDKMIHIAHSNHHHHNKNASHLANSTSNLMYESRFTAPILVNEGVSIANSNDPNCWCKKWSFGEKVDKNFDEYLR